MKVRLATVVIAGLITLLGCSSNLAQDSLGQVKSADGTLAIELEYDIPKTPYGAHPIRIYLTQESRRQLVARSQIFNDGASLSRRNAEVEFNPGFISVCLKGSQQGNQMLRIDAKTLQYSTVINGC